MRPWQTVVQKRLHASPGDVHTEDAGEYGDGEISMK